MTEREKMLSGQLYDPNDEELIGLRVQIDYGCFTSIGKNSYANFNLTILDTCPVRIGDNVFMGPNVSILTAIHPLR